LTGERFASAPEAVRWLVAVQSQDYAGAKWAVGQRTREVRDADLDRLFDNGAILRTHVMRPTWHFVLPEDVRWLLDLTAPRVKAILAHYDRRLGVDAPLLARSHAVVERALGDGAHLTRSELAACLERAGVEARGQRLGHLVSHAELDALITSGARRGPRFTYALLAERAPHSRRLDREEALAELTLRYFTGHGPAQAQDFAWWSGLTLAEVRRGLALVGSALARESIGGNEYWSSRDVAPLSIGAPVLHLLPNFDEFLVAYRDRSAALDPARQPETATASFGSILANVVLVNGQVRTGWKRRVEGGRLVVELGTLDGWDGTERGLLERAASDLARFLGVPTAEKPVALDRS
jgi:hypothetical protein